jgi:hypothetical protein
MRVELDGKAWKPVPGATATATAEEFIAARSLLHEVHQQATWSPWLLLEPSPEYEAAWKACGQWTTVEPGPPAKTLEEYEAGLEQRLADADAQFLANEAQAEKDRAERARRYDPDRDQARLALLEEQGILADHMRDRDELLARDLSRPEMGYFRSRLDTAERAIAAQSKKVEDLLAVIGDPETVCDEAGWLPAERRELSLSRFKDERISQVRTLRARITNAQTTLKTLKGRAERAKVRESLRRDQLHLAHLEQMAPLQADGMCSECAKPAWHSQGWTTNLDGGYWITGGPCPAWPRWAKRVQAIQDALRQPRQAHTAATSAAPADRRARPRPTHRKSHRPADHHPGQPPRRPSPPRQRPPLGNLASTHTPGTSRASEPLTGAIAANEHSLIRIELKAGPANCRRDEPARTALGPIRIPTDLCVAPARSCMSDDGRFRTPSEPDLTGVSARPLCRQFRRTVSAARPGTCRPCSTSTAGLEPLRRRHLRPIPLARCPAPRAGTITAEDLPFRGSSRGAGRAVIFTARPRPVRAQLAANSTNSFCELTAGLTCQAVPLGLTLITLEFPFQPSYGSQACVCTEVPPGSSSPRALDRTSPAAPGQAGPGLGLHL